MTCLGLGAGLIGIFGFFAGPVSREFGVGLATINIAPVALLLAPGLLSPLVGKLVDRLPIRRIILTGVAVAMLSLLATSRAPTLALAGLGFACFAVGLILYGPVVINGLMVKMYPGSEARAVAIAAIGISVASATLPPLVGMLLTVTDWRQALGALSIGLWIVLTLVVVFGISADAGSSLQERGQRVQRDIYRRREFWLVGLCVALGLNVTIVLAICYPPLFVSRGYSVTDAGWFLAMGGFSGLIGKSLVAWLGDAGRYYARWLAALLLLIQVVGASLLLLAQDTSLLLPAVCLLGFGGGAFIPMHPYLNSRYFDVAIVGQVNGAQMPLFLPLGLTGPPLAGYVFDRFGSYDLVLTAIMVVLVCATVFAVMLPTNESAARPK
jgi:predicted MFS family arabinose efflux permease